MITIALDTEIRRPIEEVFDFLVDVRNEPSWRPGTVRVEKTSDGPLGPGTTFKGVYKGIGTLQLELLDYERPKRYVYRGKGAQMSFVATTIVTAVDERAAVSIGVDMEPHGLFKMMAPLMRPMMKRQFAAVKASMKRALEERVAPIGS